MRDLEMGYPPLKKNDVVQVISGKYKGKSGKVLKLIKDKGLIIIEKINMIKRHTKPNQKNPQGGIIEREAPLQVCKVLPVSSKTGKPMRVAKWLRESGREETKKKTKGKARGAK